LGKHRASWPDSADGQNIEHSTKTPYRKTKDHTAIVNEGLPDLHRYQTWDHAASSSSRLTRRVKRRQADMVKFKEGNKRHAGNIVQYVIIIVANTIPTHHYTDRGLGYR
jgi:hypothetical protein